MRTVEIPDPLYDEAARRAAAHGQSLDTLVSDVLAAYLDEAPLVLTPEQLNKIDRAEAEIDSGDFYTSEQLREHFARRLATRVRENAA